MVKLVKTELIRTNHPPTNMCFPFQLLSFFLKLLLNDPPVCIAKLSKLHWNAQISKRILPRLAAKKLRILLFHLFSLSKTKYPSFLKKLLVCFHCHQDSGLLITSLDF